MIWGDISCYVCLPHSTSDQMSPKRHHTLYCKSFMWFSFGTCSPVVTYITSLCSLRLNDCQAHSHMRVWKECLWTCPVDKSCSKKEYIFEQANWPSFWPFWSCESPRECPQSSFGHIQARYSIWDVADFSTCPECQRIFESSPRFCWNV
jgi:hypothetical protein